MYKKKCRVQFNKKILSELFWIIFFTFLRTFLEFFGDFVLGVFLDLLDLLPLPAGVDAVSTEDSDPRGREVAVNSSKAIFLRKSFESSHVRRRASKVRPSLRPCTKAEVWIFLSERSNGAKVGRRITGDSVRASTISNKSTARERKTSSLRLLSIRPRLRPSFCASTILKRAASIAPVCIPSSSPKSESESEPESESESSDPESESSLDLFLFAFRVFV